MKLISSLHAYDFFRRRMTANVEEFWVLALRSDHSVIKTTCLFRGTVDSCMVHPRDVFRFACTNNASAIIVAHNHPTGDPTPSEDDVDLTEKLMGVSRAMEIPVVDHIIVGKNSYYSFSDKKCSSLAATR